MYDDEEGFDFSDLGNTFGIPLPGDLGTKLMMALIGVSKAWSALYQEHVRNGFSEEQAMRLVLSTQRDIIRAVAEVAKAMVDSQKGE